MQSLQKKQMEESTNNNLHQYLEILTTKYMCWSQFLVSCPLYFFKFI